jgi:NADH-quinone oxidoreductase subunit D
VATTTRTVEVALSTPGLDANGRPTRAPLTVTAEGGAAVPFEMPAGMEEPDMEGEHMLINIGPQHPATHGVLRLVLELDGETVVRCIPHVGYLHSGFEKLGEYRQYNQILPLTDREDYLNSMGNNIGMAMGAERLFGIEITERCTVLRVIAAELSRIMSHLVWLGTTCIDIGAFTPFLWAFQERENIYNLIERWVGARLTPDDHARGRPRRRRAGRVDRPVRDLRARLPEDARRDRPHADAERDLGGAHDRDRRDDRGGGDQLGAQRPDGARLGGGVRRPQGLPVLRLRDVRLRRPGGHNGDVYDRFLVRMEEMRQSVRILEQALARLPDGPINVDDPRLILPHKHKATSEMESMIHHFKLVMEGPRPPAGECYVPMESPKGEKGYYMVSDGTSKPVRWRIRPPSFVNLSAIPKMVEGHLLSDVIAINASIDIVMGEIDR